MLQDLPADMDAHQAFDVLAEHLGAGVMQPITVVVTDPDGFMNGQGLKRLEQVESSVTGISQVETVRSLTGSLRENKTLSVYEQLGDQAASIREGAAQLETLAKLYAAGLQPDPAVLEQTTAGFVSLFAYLQQLGIEYPESTSDPGYVRAMAALTGLAQAAGVTPGGTGVADGGSTETTGTAGSTETTGTAGSATQQPVDPALIAKLPAALDQLASGFEELQTSFADRQDALMLPNSYLASNEGLKALREAYLSQDGTAARLQVVLGTGPYAPEALAAVGQIRTTLEADGYTAAVEGSTAIVTDLKAASERDMVRVVVFVLLGVFVVLVLLLRALVAPIYLILTILLSYGATLGIVRVVFQDILGVAGVTWWVPIFMFVMLVALGMDYNIFLMGRVKEEVALSGNRQGVRVAVARTGRHHHLGGHHHGRHLRRHDERAAS